MTRKPGSRSVQNMRQTGSRDDSKGARSLYIAAPRERRQTEVVAARRADLGKAGLALSGPA
jgi:hypothetical protein